jgi:hypothetical protein
MGRKHANMAAFRDEVRRLHAKGLGPVEILRRLMGREDRVMAWLSEGDFTRLNLVEACLPGWAGPPKASPRPRSI